MRDALRTPPACANVIIASTLLSSGSHVTFPRSLHSSLPRSIAKCAKTSAPLPRKRPCAGAARRRRRRCARTCTRVLHTTASNHHGRRQGSSAHGRGGQEGWSDGLPGTSARVVRQRRCGGAQLLAPPPLPTAWSKRPAAASSAVFDSPAPVSSCAAHGGVRRGVGAEARRHTSAMHDSGISRLGPLPHGNGGTPAPPAVRFPAVACAHARVRPVQ
jgi:hypothetical protein